MDDGGPKRSSQAVPLLSIPAGIPLQLTSDRCEALRAIAIQELLVPAQAILA